MVMPFDVVQDRLQRCDRITSGIGRKRMSSAPQVSPEAMAVYRATAERRWKEEQQELARRRERAWQVARLGRPAPPMRNTFSAGSPEMS